MSRRTKRIWLVIAAEQFIGDVEHPSCAVDPHERQVPLQRASEPSAQRQGFRPVKQLFLGNFGAEAGKSPKDLQAASHQYEQGYGIHPVAEPYDVRMLIDRLGHFAGLGIFDGECAG